MILIPQQRLSPQGHQSPQCMDDKSRCDILPTSAGVKGCMLNATTVTIVTVSMANASSTSSATTTAVATTSATTRRVSPSARTRASSSATYTASTPITCTTSDVLICATKCTNYNNKLKQWASPTFITPKKKMAESVGLVILRELNKVVKRKQYPLLIILDI
jgi:hypothetical protein